MTFIFATSADIVVPPLSVENFFNIAISMSIKHCCFDLHTPSWFFSLISTTSKVRRSHDKYVFFAVSGFYIISNFSFHSGIMLPYDIIYFMCVCFFSFYCYVRRRTSHIFLSSILSKYIKKSQPWEKIEGESKTNYHNLDFTSIMNMIRWSRNQF